MVAPTGVAPVYSNLEGCCLVYSSHEANRVMASLIRIERIPVVSKTIVQTRYTKGNVFSSGFAPVHFISPAWFCQNEKSQSRYDFNAQLDSFTNYFY
jgi:hypothetical protein